MTRTEARELLMQLLYQMEANDDFSAQFVQRYIEEQKVGAAPAAYIAKLTTAIRENKDAIDDLINTFTKGWKTSRMPKVDLAVLRLAVGEILYEEALPPQVSINEAVNIAKKYSTEESGKFINGVLGAIVRDRADEQ